MLLSFLVHGKRSVDSAGKFRIILASENFNDWQGNRVGGIWWHWNEDANNTGRLKPCIPTQPRKLS